MSKSELVFHSVTLAKKNILPEFPQTLDEFPEEKGLLLVVPDPPTHKEIIGTGPMVHTPKRAAHKIEQESDSPSHGKTGPKLEEPITVGPKRLPDSPFPKVSPIPYHRPGTPYRKVDLPGTKTEVVPETLGAEILDKAEDSFEVDSESERTLTEEPKTPKFEKNPGETPEGITKRKLAPTVLPFTDKSTKPKLESKAIVRLKKIDFDTKIDIEKRPLADPKKLRGKGPETKVEIIEKPVGNPVKGHVKKVKDTEKLHKRPLTKVAAAPPAPVVRSLSRTPSVSPAITPSSPTSASAASPPLSPLALLVAPVTMGTVEEIKNALIESNRVAAMPIPQFYGKKGEKPEDHIMKVEDYFQNYNIRDQAQKCNRFRDTCCGKARTWLSILTEYPTIFDQRKLLMRQERPRL